MIVAPFYFAFLLVHIWGQEDHLFLFSPEGIKELYIYLPQYEFKHSLHREFTPERPSPQLGQTFLRLASLIRIFWISTFALKRIECILQSSGTDW